MNRKVKNGLARPKGRANLLKLLEYFGAFVVFVMMLIMLADVIGREVFNRPLPGALELIEITIVLTIFAVMPTVSFLEEHITADLFDKVLGPRGHQIARGFGMILGALIFAAAAWQIRKLGLRANSYNDITPQLGLPLAWPLFYMAVMCAVTSLSLILRLVLLAIGGPNNDPDNEPELFE